MSSDPLNSLLEGHLASLYEAGEYEDALRVASTALKNARQAAEDHSAHLPQLLKALSTLADLHREVGDFQKSESLYKEALDVAEALKAVKEQTAKIKSGIATLYDFNQREADAIPFYEQAIQDYESIEPPRLQDAAQLRNNVGMIYKSLSKYALAEQHYLTALEALEKIYGRNNERVAAVYNNLGGLYHSAGFPEQAKDMHLEALELRKKVFSADHPEVAQSFCNLATAYYDLHDDDQALANYESSLEIMEHHLATAPDAYEEIASDYLTLLENLGLDKKAHAYQKKMQKLLAAQ